MKTPQTPYPALARAIGLQEVWLKREDQHHFGSHKGRSIPHMIDEYKKQGVRQFVISSSGNAALAAMLFVQAYNHNNPDEERILLTVFVGKKIDEEKLKRLRMIENDDIHVKQVETPKRQAFQMEKSGGAKFLRQSTDDLALVGYKQLAEELNHIPNLQAVFIPTSSGTTAQALGEAFRELNQRPQIHIVQTEACHPIADALLSYVNKESPVLPPFVGEGWEGSHGRSPRPGRGEGGSLASAIVDRIAFRKNKVAHIVHSSGGAGWIVSDDDIRHAMKLVEDTTEQIISPNSALSIAGLLKAVKPGRVFIGAVVCLLTGR